jgi:hypothetical protein
MKYPGAKGPTWLGFNTGRTPCSVHPILYRRNQFAPFAA